MTVELSGEITAIATAALAAFAVVTAVFAFLAYRKQSQEVGVLLAQNEREAIERRIAQASHVFTGLPRDAPHYPYAKNGSDFPIFDAQLWYCEPSGASGPYDLGMIEPGATAKSPQKIPAGTRPGIILTFRDAAGILWRRMPDGSFTQQARTLTYKSVLGVLGVEVPRPSPKAPGPDGKHNLPTAFRHVTDDIIMVYPGGRGILSVPWKAHELIVTSSDRENQGAYIEQRWQEGSPGSARPPRAAARVSPRPWPTTTGPATRARTAPAPAAGTPARHTWVPIMSVP
jgi:hypothetical protein